MSGSCQHFQINRLVLQIFEAEQEHTVFVIDPVNFHQQKHIGTHLHTHSFL